MRWIKILFKTYAGLPKEIYILFVSTIINRMGGFVHAFLTLFLTMRLGMDLEEAGIYVALSGASVFFGTYLGGYLGDVIGRKKTYIFAEVVSALLLIPCGFLGNSMKIPYLLIGSTFLGAIVRPISSALITDLVEKENRKSTFSLLYYGINIGVAIGPIIAGYLFYNYTSWIFWGDAMTTLIATLLIYIYIPETKLSKEEMSKVNEKLDKNEKKEDTLLIIAFLKRPILVFFTLFSILTSFVYSQSNFALPATMTNLFGDKDGPVYFGNLLSFNAIIVLIFTILLAKVTEKNRPIINIAFANILYAIGFGMMAFITDIRLIFISVWIWTMGEIIGATNTGVFVASHTPISHRSRFNAIVSMLSGAGNTVGPIISGLIIKYTNMNILWFITGGVALIAFIGLLKLAHVEIRET